MGIGRREFLQLFGESMAALAVSPSRAIAILDDQYVNRKLGIAFRKPQGWTFADVKEMGEVKAGQILDLDDRELARELVDAAELPILTISKERLSARAARFAPGVTIYLNRIQCLDALPDDWEVEVPPLAHAGDDIESCQSMLRDFRVTSPPEAARVSECDAAQYTASFVFEHRNMRPTRVRMRTLAIYQRPAFYTLRMYDSPDSGGDLAFDYASFVESVKIV